MLHTLKPVLLIQMHNYFTIAAGLEMMPLRTQQGPQLHVIVNFTIGNQNQRIILVDQRLPAALEIDDT
jgi:hypothetical protein